MDSREEDYLRTIRDRAREALAALNERGATARECEAEQIARLRASFETVIAEVDETLGRANAKSAQSQTRTNS